MAYLFLNLDEKTREVMLQELESDIESKNLYYSKYMYTEKYEQYRELLKKIISEGTEVNFIELLHSKSILRTGSYNGRKIPEDAIKRLATTEFNHYYIRALCKRSLNENKKLQIYRANKSKQPDEVSERIIGSYVDPNKLYLVIFNRKSTHDKNATIEEKIGNVNSGLCVKLQ